MSLTQSQLDSACSALFRELDEMKASGWHLEDVLTEHGRKYDAVLNSLLNLTRKRLGISKVTL